MNTLFALIDVTKTYGAVTALDRLSVDVPEGAVGLLGPNGSGKTTLIRALLGLIGIDSGSGHVLDLDTRSGRLAIRQVVGYVPEDECLFPAVDGIGFVAYAGELSGMSRKAAMQRAHEVLDYVGLGEARYRRVESYSTGMKQRVKLAAGIVHDPRLLILDEPTNGMDPAGRDELLSLARDLAHNKSMNLVVSSHLLPDVESVCDYVMVLGRGRLLASGPLEELKKKHDRVYEVRVKENQPAYGRRLESSGCHVRSVDELLVVEVPAGETSSLLWTRAGESGHQIRHLRPRRSTLEEVFLQAIDEAR
jgi:ABC-2 type transport system ATP-binding protein